MLWMYIKSNLISYLYIYIYYLDGYMVVIWENLVWIFWVLEFLYNVLFMKCGLYDLRCLICGFYVWKYGVFLIFVCFICRKIW